MIWPIGSIMWLASAVVASSCRLESLVYATRCDELPSDVLEQPAPSWSDRGAFINAVDAFGIVTDGKLDLLFNNAGIGVNGLFDEGAAIGPIQIREHAVVRADSVF